MKDTVVDNNGEDEADMALCFEMGVILIMQRVLVEMIIKSKHRAASKMANCCSF